MTEPTYTTLIEPQELAALGQRPGTLVILDCRHDLARPQWGADAYGESHIPGAAHAHLDRDLSGPITSSSGRHPLPDPEALCATFTHWGIGTDTQVVAYDQASGAIAARLWWLLRYFGHARVAVLNGGLAAWNAAGLPHSRDPAPSRPGAPFERAPALEAAVSTSDVATGLGHDMLLVDARSEERFAGRNETIDTAAGHVPGARNHPYGRNLEAGRFLAPQALREQWSKTLGHTPPAHIVAMCGSGVTACHNLLAMRLAGWPGARLYPGSWSEWIRDPAHPIERG